VIGPVGARRGASVAVGPGWGSWQESSWSGPPGDISPRSHKDAEGVMAVPGCVRAPRSRMGVYTWNYFPFSSFAQFPGCAWPAEREVSRCRGGGWLGHRRPAPDPAEERVAVPAGGSGAVPSAWRVPGDRSPLPTATGSLLAPAPGAAGSASARPALAAVPARALFHQSGMLRKCRRGFPERSLELRRGLGQGGCCQPRPSRAVSSPRAQAGPPGVFSSRCRLQKGLRRNVPKAWPGAGCCPVSV